LKTGCWRPKREEGLGGWRRLHNEEFHNLFTSPNNNMVIKSRRMKWEGYVAHMGEMSNAHNILVGKPEGKRPLGRSRHRWEISERMSG
jgi:hypothetical protein